jgi:hypothetical protein
MCSYRVISSLIAEKVRAGGQRDRAPTGLLIDGLKPVSAGV